MNEYSVKPVIPTKFLDYTLDVAADGSIVLDEELRPEQLYLHDGDEFRVSTVNGRVVFVKIGGRGGS